MTSRRAGTGLIAALLLVACTGPTSGPDTARRTGQATGPVTAPTVRTPGAGSSDRQGAAPVVVATGLDVPWGLAFLPDGSALVTLRDTAEVLRVRAGSAPVRLGTVSGVQADGEGGLLGIAVSPHFADDRELFVYLTAQRDNRVLRMTMHGNELHADEVILDGIPKASVHNGGRIAFGPDGYLYVGTGDGTDGSHSQDVGSLAGKILRINREGRAPAGNPFGDSPVWSLGHRNVQGIAWDARGRMFASEFGQNTWDELNRIEPGKNYGWPVVEGNSDRDGFVNPLVQWPTSEASPSGIAIRDGAVFMAALRGESLWRIPLTDKGTAGEPQRLLQGTYGRLRTVVTAPDGRLWLVTSNTFRGTPREGDDQILILPA